MNENSQHEKSKRKTTNLWINPQFQTRFMILFTLPLVIQTVASLYFTDAVMIVATFSLLLFIFFPLAVVFSHRICGPIYRINAQMRQDAANHTMSMVRFRQNDFFVEIAGSYNILATAINESRSIK